MWGTGTASRDRPGVRSFLTSAFIFWVISNCGKRVKPLSSGCFRKFRANEAARARPKGVTGADVVWVSQTGHLQPTEDVGQASRRYPSELYPSAPRVLIWP